MPRLATWSLVSEKAPESERKGATASPQAWARALAPTVQLAFPSGSGQGTREGEAAGPAQPPPEQIRKHRLLTKPRSGSRAPKPGLGFAGRALGPQRKTQARDGFPARRAANKGGFLFAPRPRAWVLLRHVRFTPRSNNPT